MCLYNFTTTLLHSNSTIFSLSLYLLLRLVGAVKPLFLCQAELMLINHELCIKTMNFHILITKYELSSKTCLNINSTTTLADEIEVVLK